MIRGRRINNSRHSACVPRRRGVELQLRHLTDATGHASSSAFPPGSKQPYGGAIVARLAGSTKILKGEHQCLVPLLGPGDGPQPQLPFGASLECFTRPPSYGSGPEAASISSGVALSSTSLQSMDDVANSSKMLDVFYVLAGSGVVTSADGTVRKLHAGDSLIAWHNTTELRPIAGDPPPAVLKFHFPASVLMLPPGAMVAPAPSHADLQFLVNESQGDQDGELSPQEAADMLCGTQQRMCKAIADMHEPQHDSITNGKHAPAGSSFVSSSSTTARKQQPGADRASVPSVSFLQRLLRSAASPAVSSFQLLRSALSRRMSCYSPTFVAAAVASTQSMSVLASGHAAGGVESPSAGGAPAGVAASPPQPSGCVLLQRALEEFKAFRFPRQTNRLAFVFDPAELGLSLSFGVEVFEPGHRTPLHIHTAAHELFFVLAGQGVATCNGTCFPVAAGDCVVFPPRAVHGIDNPTEDARLYCLQLMTPNEAFVEHVKSGEAVGRLDDEDLCNLTSRHC